MALRLAAGTILGVLIGFERQQRAGAGGVHLLLKRDDLCLQLGKQACGGISQVGFALRDE